MLTAPDDNNDPFASADEDHDELETNESAVEDTDSSDDSIVLALHVANVWSFVLHM